MCFVLTMILIPSVVKMRVRPRGHDVFCSPAFQVRHTADVMPDVPAKNLRRRASHDRGHYILIGISVGNLTPLKKKKTSEQ